MSRESLVKRAYLQNAPSVQPFPPFENRHHFLCNSSSRYKIGDRGVTCNCLGFLRNTAGQKP